MELFVVWLSMGARGTGATLGVTASDAGFAADMLVHSVIARCARLLRSALSRQRSLFKSKLPNGFNCLYFATILDHFPWVPFRKVAAYSSSTFKMASSRTSYRIFVRDSGPSEMLGFATDTGAGAGKGGCCVGTSTGTLHCKLGAEFLSAIWAGGSASTELLVGPLEHNNGLMDSTLSNLWRL
ncbi:hypothetical protein PR001_g31473 [Phytophthora rubi]|uniref:Secreted protein n=1 Tax=Phytophthora rubi TaxID=129364 RepID=A0A6A3GJN3_9STRA|nr:hypothetical protein PR001_g31473 [Phytophthora rubi]